MIPPAEGSHLRFSLLALKFWKLCLVVAWIGMKPCLLSFSGAESACRGESLRVLLTGRQRTDAKRRSITTFCPGLHHCDDSGWQQLQCGPVPVWMGRPRWAWRHFSGVEAATPSWRWPASSRRSWPGRAWARPHRARLWSSEEGEGSAGGSATSDTQSSPWAPPSTAAAAAGCTRASAAPAPGCPPHCPPRCCWPPCAGSRQDCRRWRRSSRRRRCRPRPSRSPRGCCDAAPARWLRSRWSGWRCPDPSRCSPPTRRRPGWGGSSRRVRSLGPAGSGPSGLFHSPSSSPGCRTSTRDASSDSRPLR